MSGLGLLAGVLMTQGAVDPHLLPIGRPGTVEVPAIGIVDTSTGASVDMGAVVKAAEGVRFVFVGESHDHAGHHRFQAEVIDALVKAGRHVVVGFEMFTRPIQPELQAWTLGWQTEEEFIAKSDWKNQWGFDFALYRPIFDAVKAHRLPMVALNVPRTWVRAVGRGGLSALTPEQKAELPNDFDLTWQDHRSVFASLLGGHPPVGPSGENMYSAQVLWDVGMADSALKYMERWKRSPKAVMVVLAGSGHVMYGVGINGRLRARTGERVLTLSPTQGPGKVARGLGDFVFSTAPQENAQ